MQHKAYGVNKVPDEDGGLRARLIAAALAALERGEEPSLREVARAAGVSAMAPYRHFADKAALRGAVAVHGFGLLRQALREADSADDARRALIAQGRAYLAFARAHPALFGLMFTGHQGGPPAGEDNAYSVMVRRVAELAPGRIEPATLACWAMVHGLATIEAAGALPRGGSPDEAVALAMLIDGVTGPKPS